MTDSDLKKIEDLIAAGETGTALDEFITMLSKNADKNDFLDECRIIQARYSELTRQQNRGNLSFAEFEQGKNRINSSVIELKRQIEKGEKPGSLSFKKQNPLLFYTFHVVASLAICGLLGLFVNEGFVSGREEWGDFQKMEKSPKMILGFVVAFSASSIFVISCFYFFSLTGKTAFLKDFREQGYHVPYLNAFYYLIPSKFLFFHEAIVASVYIWGFLLAFLFIFFYASAFFIYGWLKLWSFLLKTSLEGEGFENLSSYFAYFFNMGNQAKKLEDLIPKRIISTLLGLSVVGLFAFFAYYAVGHPVAVTIYNFL